MYDNYDQNLSDAMTKAIRVRYDYDSHLNKYTSYTVGVGTGKAVQVIMENDYTELAYDKEEPDVAAKTPGKILIGNKYVPGYKVKYLD